MLATKTKNALTATQAIDIVQGFIYDELGNMISVGQPYHVVSGLQSAWSVPLFLTSPGYGPVGIVGGVIVDMEFGHIIGWTPLEEVRSNVEALTAEKEDELEAAFQTYRGQVTDATHAGTCKASGISVRGTFSRALHLI